MRLLQLIHDSSTVGAKRVQVGVGRGVLNIASLIVQRGDGTLRTGAGLAEICSIPGAIERWCRPEARLQIAVTWERSDKAQADRIERYPLWRRGPGLT